MQVYNRRIFRAISDFSRFSVRRYSALKFTGSDEWFSEETKRMGISDAAQDKLGQITHVEFLVEEGEEVDVGSEVAEVESVKATALVYSPVAGIVRGVNLALEDDPELLNQDAEGEGYILEFLSAEPNPEMLTAEEYKKKLEEDEH